ncbi:pentapeptide repeat-containing protein [Campylobacter coli]|uniref:pentapeptide repeat-containing protein n=1 Tax=Campylobacter coli TaxID=195 RepID=UPI00382FC663
MDLVSSFLSKKNINNEEDIKFENYIKGEAKLNSEKQYIIESSCCFDGNKDNFKRHYDENKILEIHLNNMVFEQYLSFHNVKKLSLIIDDNVKFQRLHIFGCNELSLRINGRVKIIDKISINNCKFKQISINNHIDGNIEFQKCEFNDFNLYGFSNATIKGTFTFDFCEIKEKVNFMNFEFENKVSFKMSKFKDNVYFNNSHFKDYADFHECEFEKIACFYGVKFYKTPNFSACYFKEPKAVNLINVDIDKLDFKSVEKYIEDNYKDESYKNETKGIQDKKEFFKIKNKHKLRYAKNLKDSFRVIKDVLITQNNTLEAQEWHKLELYAKEKENHINLSVKDREKNADIFKNILIWFNCVLLNVYRNTSDHHNDFLKILNFTVGMIVLYGVFIFFCQACIEPYSKFFNELKSSVIFIIIGILVFLCCIMFYFNRKKSIFAKSIFFIIAMVFIVLYLVTYFYKTNEYKTILYLVMCYILSIYICYFFFNIKNIIFNIVFKFMLYLVFLFFLINSSQLINPFTGVFSSDKLYESKFEKSLNDLNASAIINLAKISFKEFNLHQEYKNISFAELNSAKASIVANKENLLKLNDVNSNIAKEVLGEKYTELLKTINQDKITENTIKSTSVLYSIILLLCIFSLQKTARKNSIVPS